MKTKSLYYSIATCLLAGGCPINAFSAAGDLDPSFGTGGIVITSLNGVDDRATSIALQPDGKILAAGFSKISGKYEWAVVRYNSDGTLDTTFNGTGKVFTAFPYVENGPYGDKAFGLALQDDGKIVLAGFATNASFYFDIALARYNTDGSLDTTFNGTGTVTTHFSGYSDFATGLVIQSDGKIVIGGYGTDSGSSDTFELARYNPDGSLDTMFNGSGLVKADIGGAGLDDGFAIALQQDGKLILTGDTYAQRCCTGDFALARYNSDGSFDTAFNGSGAVITPTATYFQEAAFSAPFHGISLQTDGRIVVAGSTSLGGSGDDDLIVVRYNPDGSLDTGFNGTGEVITTGIGPLGAAARGVVVQGDDKIVVAGVAYEIFSDSIALVRYDPDGSLDTTFNGTGKVITSIGASSAAQSVALQNDGKIVIAGSTYSSNVTSFVLARYNSGSEPPPLDLTSALSRTVHGSAGAFDVNLPLTGDPGVECRSTRRGRYTLVFTFSNNVVNGTAGVTSGTATITGAPFFSGTTMTVNLTGVTDLQTLTITLTGVTDSFAQVLPATAVSVKMLIGDTNADKTVDGSDVTQTRDQVGMPVTSINFREDVKVDGAINNADVKLVKTHRGATLP